MLNPSSAYRLILDALRSHAARTPAGTRLSSEHELARHYGVSRGTARRALDELMREGHAVRVQGKGTFVAPPQKRDAAQRGAARTIALVVGDVRRIEPLFLHAVEAACAAAGYRLQLASSGGDAAREIAVLRALRDEGCAGMLIRSYQHAGRSGRSGQTGATHGLEALAAAGVPFVLVDRTVPGIAADSVTIDHEDAAYRITRDLLELGHRRIALLLHRRTPPSTSIEARVAGYGRAHTELDVPLDERLIVECGPPLLNGLNDDAGRPDPLPPTFRTILDLLRAVTPAVTAWIGVNDLVAASALRHALDVRVAVPDELSVAGFDGSAFATLAALPLTTIAQPHEQLGVEATARLLRRIADPSLAPVSLLLPAPLRAGSTTAPPLAAALAAVAQHRGTLGGKHVHQP